MAFQNVGTPRFYVNVLEWLNSTGNKIFEGNYEYIEVYNLLPVKMVAQDIGEEYGGNWSDIFIHSFIESISPTYAGENMPERGYFTAILGHNAMNTGINLTEVPGVLNLVNFNYPPPIEYNGFSIGLTTAFPSRIILESGVKVGSIAMGTIYEMTNAPDLSLTLGREYGSTKEFTTHNGSSMSNTMWSSPSRWGGLGAWELYDGTGISQLSRSGRRTWDLKFSFMDDSDLWGSNQMLGLIREDTSDGTDDDDVDYYNNFDFNLLTDYNFFSQVWHKTLGGTLPFIFQPDNTNANPDQFAICRFIDNSLKAEQSAFNVYDISLSIEEVW